MLSVIERDWSCLLVYLWEIVVIFEEEKVEKESGYLFVSDNICCEVLFFLFLTLWFLDLF